MNNIYNHVCGMINASSEFAAYLCSLMGLCASSVPYKGLVINYGEGGLQYEKSPVQIF